MDMVREDGPDRTLWPWARGALIGAGMLACIFSRPLPARAGCDQSPTGRNPKLVWTCQQQAIWDQMVGSNDPWWLYIQQAANAEGTNGQHYADLGDFGAIAYQMTGDATYARKAWAIIQPEITGPVSNGNSLRGSFIRYALMYDWLYPALTAAERTAYYNGLNTWGDWCLAVNVPMYTGGFRVNDYDQMIGQYFGLAFIDLATGPDNPRAGTFLNAATSGSNGTYKIAVGGLDATGADFTTVRNSIAEFAKVNGSQGYASTEYNYGTDPELLLGYLGVLTATGVDHFPEITQLISRYALQMVYSIAPDGNTKYTWGDSEHQRSLHVQTMENFVGLLAGMTKNDPQVGPYTQRLMQQLTAWPGEYAAGARPYPDPFYTWNPNAVQAAYSALPLGFYEPAQGLMYSRDGWTTTSSFFGAQMPAPIYDDHDVAYLGDFQLWRKGEWAITRPLGYGGPSIYGNAVNAMLISGLSSMASNRGPIAQEFGPNNEYAYLAGSTTGQFYLPGTWNPPPTFLNEWTRSIFYLPSSDKKSDTIVIYDRTNALDPKTLPGGISRYAPGDQARINSALALKEWIIHSPVAPTVSANSLSWTTAGGQQVSVSMLLPADSTQTVLDETALWGSLSGIYDASELHFQTHIMPKTSRQWDTFLNVVQVSDAGTSLTNTMVQSSGGEAQGVLIRRGGLPDTLVMFGASQAQRLIEAGYTVTFHSIASNTLAYFLDFDPGTRYTYAVDGGVARALSLSSAGVARLSIPGAGPHTVVFNGVPAAPTIATQPSSLSVAAGQSVSLSVGASGSQPLSFAWQSSSDGVTWTNISGANADPYVFYALLSQNGTQFRVVVRNGFGSATSNPAALSVTSNGGDPPAIVQQPRDATLSQGAGESFSFHVGATGATLKYQWQREDAGASSFIDISGAAQSTYTVAASEDMDEALFRCVVSNSLGGVTSSTAALRFPGASGMIGSADVALDYNYDRNGMRGHFRLTLPRGSLPLGSRVKIIRADQMAGSAEKYKHTGMGIHINTWGLEPSAAARMSVDALGGVDTTKPMTLAFYDTASGQWTAVPTALQGSQWVGTLSHFSTYALMQVAGAGDFSSAKVYPNPFRPSQGHTVVNFVNLPANTRIRIYTLAGEKVKELSADGAGTAVWDARSGAGSQVSSGVYFAVVEGNGKKKILNLAVQR